MKKNKFGEMIFAEEDLCNLLMQGQDVTQLKNLVVDPSINIERLIHFVQEPGDLLTWTFPHGSDQSIPEFDAVRINKWLMPEEYHDLDIAKYVLDLCTSQAQLQRVGEELLLYQQYNLFDLLRYLKYLVDVMKTYRVIWGVGRGSSVSSYVLFLLGVHRVDSMFYDLDPREFLR